MAEERRGFFDRNKPISYAIIIACMLFIGTFFLKESKVVIELVPTFRGEVRLPNNFVITSTKSGCPVIVRKDDPKAVNVRFSGEIRSNFDKVVHSLYSSNSTIIEVGSHFGERTLEFGNRVRGAGKVFAFEANYGVFLNLKKSIMLNDLEDVISVKNIGIYDHKCSLDIRDNLSLTRESDGKITRKRNITVQCDTLDAEMSSFPGEVDLLSIDIPQSEYQILRGSEKIIRRSPNIVIIVAIDSESGKENIRKELNKFQNLGFNFYHAKNDGTLSAITLEEILKIDELILVITKRELSTS